MLEQSLFPKEPSLPYPPNIKKPRERKRKMGDSKCILSEWLSLMKIVWGILVAFIVWTPKKKIQSSQEKETSLKLGQF